MELGSVVSSQTDQLNQYFFNNLDNTSRNKIARRSYKADDVQVIGESFCQVPRIVYTNKASGKQRIFVMGGQMADHYIEKTCELVEVRKGEFTIQDRAPMPTAKISFGCCVDELSEFFYTVGGLEAKDIMSRECTAYSI